MSSRIGLILLLQLLVVTAVFAAQEIYPFESSHQADLFERLTKETRCVVCQNQSLAESNVPIAQSIKTAIYHKILLGQDSATIKAFLQAQYGDYILYTPPFNQATLGLWGGPLLFLGLAVMYLWRARGKHRG